jgi:hypothetical protein
MFWFLTVSHSVLLTAIQSLVSNVICAADFNASDFIGFSAMREAKHLDKYKDSLATSKSLDPESFTPPHG